MTIIEVDHEDGKIYVNSKMVVRLEREAPRAQRMLEKMFTEIAKDMPIDTKLNIKLKERIEGRAFLVGKW